MNHRLVLKSAMFGAETCATALAVLDCNSFSDRPAPTSDRHVWRSSFGRDLLPVPNRPATLEMERAHNLPDDACHGQGYPASKERRST